MLTDLIHKKKVCIHTYGFWMREGISSPTKLVLCISVSLRLATFIRHEWPPFLVSGCHSIHHKECIENDYHSSQLV